MLGEAPAAVLSNSAEDDLRFHLSSDGPPLETSPFPAALLEDAALRIIDVFFFRRDDEITESQRLTSRQLFAGQALRLRYTDETLRKVREMTAQRDVRMFVQAHPFAPEANSGADRSPASATSVPRSRVYEDGVDFNTGDATDHLSVAEGPPCLGVLLLKSSPAVTLTSSPAGDGDAASTPSATRLARNRDGSVLYSLDCSHRGLLRIHASKPGAKASYLVYAGRGQRYRKATVTLVQRWLETWPLAGETLDEQSLDEARRGIDAIVQRTAGGTADLVAAYDAYLQALQWNDRAAFLTTLLALDGPAPQPDLAVCCKESEAFRFLVNLTRAEVGAPFDCSAVAWGRRFAPPFETELEVRVTKVLGPRPPPK